MSSNKIIEIDPMDVWPFMVETGINITTSTQFEHMLRKHGKIQLHVLRKKDGSIYYEPSFVYGTRPKREPMHKVLARRRKRLRKAKKVIAIWLITALIATALLLIYK